MTSSAQNIALPPKIRQTVASGASAQKTKMVAAIDVMPMPISYNPKDHPCN